MGLREGAGMSAANRWHLGNSPKNLNGPWRIDPYLAWAELSHWAGFGEATASTQVRVLMESYDEMSGDGALADWLKQLIASNPLNRSRFATANVPVRDLTKLTAA